MTPTPIDALKSINPLDSLGLLSSYSSREQAGNDSFAQHLSPPRESYSTPQPAAPPSGNERPRPSADASSNQKPAVNGTDSVNRSERPQTSSTDNAQPVEQADATPGNDPAQAEAAKAAGSKDEQQETEGDEEAVAEATPVTDPLLAIVAAQPVVAPPVDAKVTVTSDEAPTTPALLADEKPAAVEIGQPVTKGKEQAVEEPLLAVAVAEKVAAPSAEEQVVASEVAVAEVVTSTDATVAAATNSQVNAESATTKGELPSARQQEVAQQESDRAAATTEDQLLAKTATEAVATTVDSADTNPGKGRDGKKERTRSEQRSSARGAESNEPSAQQDSAASAPAATDVKPAEVNAAPVATTATPEMATAPVAANGNSSTPPAVTENGSAAQRLPQQLMGRATQRGNSGGPVTVAEQARLVQRVAKAFQAAQARGGELRLRLNPAELGALKLEVKVEGGVMSARIEAETATAKQIILDNLPVLKERLAEQGIRVEQFDVDLMDQQPQGQPDSPQGQERQATPRAPHVAFKAREAELPEATTAPRGGGPAALDDGRLNVTV